MAVRPDPVVGAGLGLMALRDIKTNEMIAPLHTEDDVRVLQPGEAPPPEAIELKSGVVAHTVRPKYEHGNHNKHK